APAWLDGVQEQFDKFTWQMQEEMNKALKRLDVLAERVEEALRRSGAVGAAPPNGVAGTGRGASRGMEYVEQRQSAGAKHECPLPELFTVLRENHPELSIVDFQDGLRRMSDHKAIRLLPLTNGNGSQPEPEYIMCDGPELLYYVSR